MIRNVNADGFGSLYPKYKSGRPPKFTLPQRRAIKKIARTKPAEHDLPFSTSSLSKLAEFLVAEGWSTISATRAFGSCSARKARVEYLYAIADREMVLDAGEPACR